MDADVIEPGVRSSAEVEELSIGRAAYESPELLELGLTVLFLRGIIMDAKYYDCGFNGVTNYRPTC